MPNARLEWSIALQLTQSESRLLLDSLLWFRAHAVVERAVEMDPIILALQRAVGEISSPTANSASA